MKKRLLSFLLALVMLLGMIPMASAAPAEAITIDFKSLASEVSGQDWWNDLVMGSKGSANMGESELTQYNALRNYLAANKNWNISEEWSQFNNMWQAKEMVLNTDVSKAWGLRYYAGYVGVDTHDKMYIELNVTAEQAGWYTLSSEIFKESVYSTQASHGFQGGGGYGMILVNGETALEEMAFVGQDTAETVTGNVIKLNEGTNLIAIRNTKDVNGQASNAIRSLCLNSITFTPAANPCTHESTTASVTSNGDKTHTVSAVCAACGDVVSSEVVSCTDEDSDSKCDICSGEMRDTLTIDFKALASEVSGKDWWNDLVMGSKGAAHMAGSELEQYNALRNYLSETKNWTISEDWSQFSNMYQAKEIVLNTDASKAWGLRYYAGYVGVDTHDKMYIELDVTAEQAGWYELSTEIFKESVYSTQASHGFQGGGGYGMIYVNGNVALEETYFLGADAAETLTGSVIKLNEGTNLIAIRNTKDVNGGNSNAIRSLCLNNIVFTKTENPCTHANTSSSVKSNTDKTHTTTVTCSDCGDIVSAETSPCVDNDTDVACDICGNDLRMSIAIDFKALASEVADKDWWSDLVMGSKGAANMGESELAQYTALRNYLDETRNWNISEDWSQFNNMYQAKEMVLNTDASKAWGLRYYAGYVGVDTHDKMYIELDVTAEEAGIYQLSTEIFRESVYSAQASHGFQGGGGYGMIYVNGDVALDEMRFLGEDTVETIIGNTIELREGSNLIAIRNTKDVNGDASNAIRSLCLNNIVLTKIADPEPEIVKFDLAGANMTLGNDLKMNFLIKKEDFKDGYVAKVTQTGREPVELELWSYNDNYYAASYSVAAKEMTDVLSCEIYDAEGNLVTNPFTRTVAQYALTLLNNASQKAALKSVIVDMLNYGTEAQKYFDYNEDAYANADVTEAQQAEFATGDVECANNQIKGDKFAGANLSLEDSILLNVFFSEVYADDLTATVTFTDYLGNEVNAEGEVSKHNASLTKVIINQVVLADAKRPVTVTLYKDGTEIGSGVESVESYIARNLQNASTGAINMAIMKFATSAYIYLGGTN